MSLSEKCPRIVLTGPPAAGKGRHSRSLADQYTIPHIETGRLLREYRDYRTSKGKPSEYMNEGKLVPDSIVNEIIGKKMSESSGFVLDGYPRTIHQTEFLNSETTLDIVIHLTISDELIIDRLSGRRVCDSCGRTFHDTFEPPDEKGICDHCGGSLFQREDDTPPVIRTRIEEYEKKTGPVIEMLRDNYHVVTMSGERDVSVVWSNIKEEVEKVVD